MPAWKTWERELVSRLQQAAGRVSDKTLSLVVTKTGRAGHIYELETDGFVGDKPGVSLVVEAKRVKMPKWLRDWLEKLMLHASEYRRFPVLGINLDSDYGRKQKLSVTGLSSLTGLVETIKFPIIDKWCFIPFDYFQVLVETARKHPELVDDYWQKVNGTK